MEMQGCRPGEKPERGVRNAGRRLQLVEGQRGVFIEIDGRCVFELDFRTSSRARDQIEAGLEWEIGHRGLPDCVFLSSRDAHIAFNVADANNLRVGFDLPGRGLCRRLRDYGGRPMRGW